MGATASDLGCIIFCPNSQMQSDRATKSPATRVKALRIQVFQPQTDEMCPEALSSRLPQSAGILLTQTTQRSFALLYSAGGVKDRVPLLAQPKAARESISK